MAELKAHQKSYIRMTVEEHQQELDETFRRGVDAGVAKSQEQFREALGFNEAVSDAIGIHETDFQHER